MNIKTTLADAELTFARLIQLLRQISQEQLNVVPFNDSWTAGQDAQHIILSAQNFVKLLNGPISDTNRDPEEKCGMFRDILLNYELKLKSPDFIMPERRMYDKQELINALEIAHQEFLQAIEKLDPTPTCLLFELPNTGYITRAEAFTFVIVHTQRHAHQLKNIAQSLAIHLN